VTLQASGQITLLQVATEFGGAVPHSVNEYYRGGANVVNQPPNLSIPAAGQISFSDFYGGAKAPVISLTSGTVSSTATHTGSGTSPVTAAIRLQATGTGSPAFTGVTTSAPPAMSTTQWARPTQAAVGPPYSPGQFYWYHIAITAGSGLGVGLANPAVVGAWTNLGDTTFLRDIGLSRTQAEGVGSKTCTVTIRIATDAAGANVVATSSVTFTVSRT
jgi:hypothetical protein